MVAPFALVMSWHLLDLEPIIDEQGYPYSSPEEICFAIKRGVKLVTGGNEVLMPAKDACATLGISRQTLRRGTRIGKIPHKIIGWLTGYERVLIPMSYIDYINTNPKKDRAVKRRTEMAGVLL